MSPEAQRIVIAETCGWKRGSYGTWSLSYAGGDKTMFSPPNYLTDLNAMHEAEQVIRAKGQLVINNWLDNLCIIANGESAEMDGSYKEVDAMVSSSAAERAEAFLRTINKWDDSK